MNRKTEFQKKHDREFLLSVLERHGVLDASQEELFRRKTFLPGKTCIGGGVSFYRNSFFREGGLLFFLAGVVGQESQGGDRSPEKRLFLISRDPIPPEFQGVRFKAGGRNVLDGECSFENYLAMKEYLPFTAPVSLRNRKTTIGCGDRLGLAGPGHIRAARPYDIHPVLAQLSMRELNLTGRNYPQVVKDAAFSVLQEGFDRGYGADGDHLKTIADIDTAVEAGMPMITLDLTEVMDPAPAQWSSQAVEDGFARLPESVRQHVLSNYGDKSFTLEKAEVRLSGTEAKRCALMYWKALEFTGEVDSRLRSKRGDAYDLEVSIDETTAPTIPSHHLFIASELQKRGVAVNSLAPRFIGEFQKGIDYIGDLAEFGDQFAVHCEISRAFGGYKISIHSGSDKFSTYPVIGKLTGLRVHVKTAGTSWLEAVRAISISDPPLFRSMLEKAYHYFPDALKLYHITADLSKIPGADSVPDDRLASYLEAPESRQLLHVTYGGLLNDREIRPFFFALLKEREELHYHVLQSHLTKHIALLGAPLNG